MGRLVQIDGQGNRVHLDFPPYGIQDPLDHDHDGVKGGSVKGSTRRPYKRKTKKKIQ